MSGWDEYFDAVLKRGAREYVTFQNWKVCHTFMLKHGRPLIGSAERLLAPLIGEYVDNRRRLAEREFHVEDAETVKDQNNSDDPFMKRAAVVEKAEQLVRRMREVEKRIREDFPEEAEDIIETFRDLVEGESR